MAGVEGLTPRESGPGTSGPQQAIEFAIPQQGVMVEGLYVSL